MSIYRQYEDPYALEEELTSLLKEKEEFIHTEDNWQEYADLCESIHELKERVNFAWQDDEAAMEGWD